MLKTSYRLPFLDAIADKLAGSLNQALARTLLNIQTPLVTEARRTLQVKRPMAEGLPQRLRQLAHRQALVPTQISVRRKGTELKLFWPEAAVRRMLIADACGAYYAGGSEEVSEAAQRIAQLVMETVDGLDSDNAALLRAAMQPLTQTTLCAEYLRSHSPSTDVIGSDYLIYGRRGIAITDVIPVGHYAARLQFSDGHNGGIYPYEYLWELGRVGDHEARRAVICIMNEALYTASGQNMHNLLTTEGQNESSDKYGPPITSKFGRMKHYLKQLRDKRKKRDPPVSKRTTR